MKVEYLGAALVDLPADCANHGARDCIMLKGTARIAEEWLAWPIKITWSSRVAAAL